jgi:hypothetical protein
VAQFSDKLQHAFSFTESALWALDEDKIEVARLAITQAFNLLQELNNDHRIGIFDTEDEDNAEQLELALMYSDEEIDDG